MKKLIFSVAIITTAAIAGWNYQQNQTNTELSDLALANIEALASGEGSKDCDIYCKTDYRYTCLISWGGEIEGITCPGYRKK